ncbi:MAG: hypothetical protein WD696_11970 [Bryobacteraceae bacterium]
MSLGYVLLHPSRVEQALLITGDRRFMNEMTDVVFGAMGASSHFGQGFEDYAASRVRFVEGLVDQLRSFIEPSGPLGFLRVLAEDRTELPDFGALLDRLANSLSSPSAFKEQLRSILHGVVNLLPDNASASISVSLREQFNAFTEILETPLRNGQNDHAAHRGFRAAVTLRQVFGPLFEQVLTAGLTVDIKAFLLRFIDDLLIRIQLPELERIAGLVADLRLKFGGMIRAFGNLNASFSVSVSVGGGPSGMANGTLTAEQQEWQAAPDPPGHWLWVLDLITGIFATFSSIWEMVRAGNWKGREGDGVLNIIGILWHVTHTLMRAAFRDQINLQTFPPQDASLDKRFVNWIFTDQGNLAVNTAFRFFGSIHDMVAPSNWAQSFVPSMLKYYSNMVNYRAPYWSLRSYRYFHRRKQEGNDSTVNISNAFWGIWGPWWFFSSLFGLVPAWEHFTLEEGLGEARTVSSLIIGLAIGAICGYVIPSLVMGKAAFGLELEPDWPALILIGVLFILGTIGVGIILSGVESDDVGGATIAFIVVSIFLGIALIVLASLALSRTRGAANSVFLHIVVIVAGLLLAGILPYFLWWFYIDDGRDKEGVFDGMDPDTSPYKLPYPSEKNLVCSQGVHGLFSHYPEPPTESDNHYSYDFNDKEGNPALAARGGIVVEYRDDVLTGEPRPPSATSGFTGNSIDVQHIDWVSGHDPGVDLERVLTRGEYIHSPLNSAHVDTGHRIVQGYHICDIDSTGRSAVNHLHFNVAEDQTTVDRTYPAIFRDDNVRRFRSYPILVSWPIWPGGWHIEGKPVSNAFYISENTQADAVPNPIRVRTSDAGTPPHAHFVELDRRAFDLRVVPDSVTVFTVGTVRPVAAAPGTPAGPDHFHQVTLTRADLQKMFAMRSPDTFAVTEAGGHTHGFGSIARRRGTAPSPAISIVDPPAAQWLAARPFPYKLLGDQLVMRINERATEFVLCGAHRPALLGDIALDRGLLPGAVMRIDSNDYALPAALTATAARASARDLSSLWAAGSAPSPGVRVIARCVPAIVIETRRRGSSASLNVTFGTAAQSASGTGVFGDLSQVPVANLATHITSILQTGWANVPAGLNVGILLGQVTVDIGGAAVDFTPSSSRISQVLTGLYSIFEVLQATGAMPLSTGRVAIGGGTPWHAPIVATPAEIRIDSTNAAFTGDNLTASPLFISALGADQPVVLSASDNSAAAIARQINLQAEGVRAWAEGSAVVVQTVAGGSDARLAATKTTSFGSATGASAPLPAGVTALSDTTAVLPDTLKGVLDDAISRDTPPYNPAVVNPQASVDGGRLVIEVAAGQSIGDPAAFFTGTPLFTLSPASGERLQTDPLPATLAFTGPAWIDLTVAGQPTRIPIDGEAARIDLNVLERMPANGETLQFSVNGGATETVTFSGAETSLREVAAAIGIASDDLVVRIAYRLSIENERYEDPAHALELGESTGLTAAGFLRRASATLQSDAIGFTGDLLNVTSGAYKRREDGGPMETITVTELPSGSGIVWRLEAAAPLRIQATHVDVAQSPDPLGLPTAAATSIDTVLLATETDLGSQCREYLFEILAENDDVLARSRMQIAASPAILRTISAPFLLPAGVTPTLLNVTVIAPGAPERTYPIELAGLRNLEDLAQRITDATPDLRAWTVRVGGIQLHVETAGAGKAWGLRIDNLPLLLALGFSRTGMDLSAGTLSVSGSGTVANGRAVTHTEIRDAFGRVVASLTGVAARLVRVAVDGAGIALSSTGGPVTIETEPSSLRAALNVTEAAAQTTLAPGGPLNVDHGSIIVKVGATTRAVAHIWGAHAFVRGNLNVAALAPADLTAMLTLLSTASILIEVDGLPHAPPPVPASTATIEEAIQFLAGHVPRAWIGIVGGVVVFESRRAGTDSEIVVDFSNFASGGTYPAGTVLGFEVGQLNDAFAIGDEGAGSVERTDNIPVLGSSSSLFDLLRQAAIQTAAPQAIYDVELEPGTPAIVRLRAHLNSARLRYVQAPIGPNSIAFVRPAGAVDQSVLEAQVPAGIDLGEPGVFQLTADVGIRDRVVTALIAARPARLPALVLPTAMSVLNLRGFRLTVGADVFAVVFSANAATTPAEIASQVERQCAWAVRARIDGTNLIVETRAIGSGKELTLDVPTGSTPNAITGNSATGFTAPSALPIDAAGDGPVSALDAVAPDELQGILLRAHISDAAGDDSAVFARAAINSSGYDAVDTSATPTFLSIASNRIGCTSRVNPVVNLSEALALGPVLPHGPACRASIALPAFLDEKTLNGNLHIEFNDNAGAADLPPAVVIAVNFPNGGYNAREVARRIHEALFDLDIGQAAAYPDGTVVIETSVPGLAGTVRIPAPGTATAGNDRTVLESLLGSTEPVIVRGWPGIGFGTVRDGLRSVRSDARSDAEWVFTVGGTTRSTTPIPVTSGQTLSDIQSTVDSALASVPDGRIGICALGPDGTLYVEAGPTPLVLSINGTPWPVRVPQRPGETPELQEEPALGWRQTFQARTVRYARDRFGSRNEDEFDDAQWVRLPADANGITAASLFFPRGIYWTAARAHAAATTGYDASGEMIVSAGVDPNDDTQVFVHRARYWIDLGTGVLLRVVRHSSGEFRLEIVL